MAGKSAIPLILVAGGAALLLSGKKKKATPKDEDEITSGGASKMKFDKECMGLAIKLSESAHNDWLTNRYYQLLAEGMDDLDQLTVQLLKEQDSHCPWDDQSKWTPFMTDIYNQLRAGVVEWHERTGGKGLPKE